MGCGTSKATLDEVNEFHGAVTSDSQQSQQPSSPPLLHLAPVPQPAPTMIVCSSEYQPHDTGSISRQSVKSSKRVTLNLNTASNTNNGHGVARATLSDEALGSLQKLHKAVSQSLADSAAKGNEDGGVSEKDSRATKKRRETTMDFGQGAGFFEDEASDLYSETSMSTASHQTKAARATLPRCGEVDVSETASTVMRDCAAKCSAALELNPHQMVELPASVREMGPHLQVLDLSNGPLRRVSDIASFTSLRRLCLSNNELSEMPDDLGCLSSLQELDLSYNTLTRLPDSIASLKLLRYCKLDFNDFLTFPVKILTERLEELYLAENHHLFSLPSAEVLSTCKVLRILTVDNPPSQVAFAKETLGDFANVITWNKIYPDRVLDNMYIGSLRSAQTDTVYSALNIKFVVSCGKGMSILNKGVQRLELPVEDVEEQTIRPYFYAFKQFVDQSEGKGAVLVHCFAGRSRSATMVLSYLMSHNGMRLDAALEYLLRIRPSVHPNSTFMRELLSYDAELFATK